jgi:hypothetical protein
MNVIYIYIYMCVFVCVCVCVCVCGYVQNENLLLEHAVTVPTQVYLSPIYSHH